ncbi:rhombosortase [Parvibaculum sp.]|jgi:rhomboid family GlyGly-CTERM serine protease|uniref:rhombosortase n=1 Tax=Parvibaculum sp. TaxID=2024848 RepID=UPI002FDB3E09
MQPEGQSERNHGGISLPWFPLLLTGAMALIHHIGAAASDMLIFDRAKIMDGELWRLVSGHLVHLNFQHLIWNGLAYLVLAVMARHDEGISYTRQGAIIFAGVVAIDTAILLSPTQLSHYAGFSGVLNALWAVMIVEAWRQKRSGFIALIGFLSLAKIVYEAVTAETLFFYTPWPAAFEGHAGGAVAGLLFLVAERAWPVPFSRARRLVSRIYPTKTVH